RLRCWLWRRLHNDYRYLFGLTLWGTDRLTFWGTHVARRLFGFRSLLRFLGFMLSVLISLLLSGAFLFGFMPSVFSSLLRSLPCFLGFMLSVLVYCWTVRWTTLYRTVRWTTFFLGLQSPNSKDSQGHCKQNY